MEVQQKKGDTAQIEHEENDYYDLQMAGNPQEGAIDSVL